MRRAVALVLLDVDVFGAGQVDVSENSPPVNATLADGGEGIGAVRRGDSCGLILTPLRMPLMWSSGKRPG